MAKSARKTATHIAVNGVYTLPEYRQRGYAAAVVAHICKLILNEGKIPLLYTDLANPCSNKAYTNVGFVPCGKVDEVHLKWK
jgi:predicted GNAT family acetyltransferase